MNFRSKWGLFVFIQIFILGFISYAYADNATNIINGGNLFDKFLKEYHDKKEIWQNASMEAATWLFWSLATISLVWTFGMMLFRKADFSELFVELFRFVFFTGLYWYLLQNAPSLIIDIQESFREIGINASQYEINPSGLMDIGFEVLSKVQNTLSMFSVSAGLLNVLLGLSSLFIMVFIAANLVILLCTAWVLAYGGIFILGFGGLRWTSDIAINYYKVVLSNAVKILITMLLLGVGNQILINIVNAMSTYPTAQELSVFVAASLLLLLLVYKIPEVVASTISNFVTNTGMFNFNSGAVTVVPSGNVLSPNVINTVRLSTDPSSNYGNINSYGASYSKMSQALGYGYVSNEPSPEELAKMNRNGYG